LEKLPSIWNSEKKNTFYISDLGNSLGEEWQEKCLTSYYFKEQIHPNFGNTVKILAPLTSVPETMTLFP
jgi:hypothetical protein